MDRLLRQSAQCGLLARTTLATLPVREVTKVAQLQLDGLDRAAAAACPECFAVKLDLDAKRVE